VNKPISRRQHGFAEYSYITTVAAAPNLAGFEDDKTAASLCRCLSGAALATSLFTRAEWGLIRVIPYKVHVGIDFLSGILALGAPWAFGFSDNERARNTFLVMGATAVVVSLLSDPQEMPESF
jgi:hypothetical protein